MRLQTREDIENFLKKEMPGTWIKKHITMLESFLPYTGSRFYKSPGKTECVVTKKKEIEHLCETINMEFLNDPEYNKNIFEPFNGTGIISNYIKENYKNINVYTNDICDKHGNSDYNMNCLDSTTYDKFEIDVIITSPWYAILDLVVPMLMNKSKLFVALHIPSHYITNSHANRTNFIKKLAKRRRIRIINSNCSSSIGWKCIWLIIFKDARTANTYIKEKNSIPYYIN